jgi:hypothetical protein
MPPPPSRTHEVAPRIASSCPNPTLVCVVMNPPSPPLSPYSRTRLNSRTGYRSLTSGHKVLHGMQYRMHPHHANFDVVVVGVANELTRRESMSTDTPTN